MESLFNMINTRLFGDKLPDCTIILFNGSDYLTLKKMGVNCLIDGLCTHDNKSWIIGIDKNLTGIDYFNTLVHEMIHVWQWETYRKMNHGTSFKTKCLKAYEEFYL